MGKLILKVLRFLHRAGLLRRPRKELYSVVISVHLDNKEIKKFPAEIMAFGRAAARYEIRNRLKFTTGTSAKNLGKNYDGEYVMEVYLKVELHDRVLQTFPVLVNVSNRREAKFGLAGRLSFKATSAAMKKDLLKHRLNKVATANK